MKFLRNILHSVGTQKYPRYHLSPHEQKAFSGALRIGVIVDLFSRKSKEMKKNVFFCESQVPNTLWRIRSSVFTVMPPFLVTYLIYDWANKEYDRLTELFFWSIGPHNCQLQGTAEAARSI